jgi:hypothetical protein
MAKEGKAVPNTGLNPWHSALSAVFELELEQYRDILEFHSEFPLNDQPLRIDLLVIVKPAGVSLEKNIARIFRRYNIVELKSPTDNLTVYDFYKVYGYACVLMSDEKRKVSVKDISLSFVVSQYPKNLMKYFEKDLGYRVTEEERGIYYVKGDKLRIQIIDSRQVSEEENLYVRGLNMDLHKNQGDSILKELEPRTGEACVRAYLHVMFRGNPQLLKEERVMRSDAALNKVLKEIGFTERWIEEGRLEGRLEGALETARNLLKKGWGVKEVAEGTKLSLRQVRALKKKLDSE